VLPGYLYAPLRRVEEDLPDAVPNTGDVSPLADPTPANLPI